MSAHRRAIQTVNGSKPISHPASRHKVHAPTDQSPARTHATTIVLNYAPASSGDKFSSPIKLSTMDAKKIEENSILPLIQLNFKEVSDLMAALDIHQSPLASLDKRSLIAERAPRIRASSSRSGSRAFTRSRYSFSSFQDSTRQKLENLEIMRERGVISDDEYISEYIRMRNDSGH